MKPSKRRKSAKKDDSGPLKSNHGRRKNSFRNKRRRSTGEKVRDSLMVAEYVPRIRRGTETKYKPSTLERPPRKVHRNPSTSHGRKVGEKNESQDKHDEAFEHNRMVIVAIIIAVNLALLIGATTFFILVFTACDKTGDSEQAMANPSQGSSSSPGGISSGGSDSSSKPTVVELELTEYDEIVNPNHRCGIPDVKPDLKKSRIVGGAEAVPNSWPYTVGLGTLTFEGGNFLVFQMCGATLISPRHALTAVHCFIDDTQVQQPYSVFASLHSTLTYDSFKLMRVAVVRFHPKSNAFNTNNPHLVYDFALLTLRKEFTPSRNIQIACLPMIRKTLPEGTVCWATGWGNTEGTGSPNLLKQVPIDVVSERRCQDKFHPSIMMKSTLCGGTTPGQDTCQGDSGGPLYRYEDGKWVLYGVTSYGAKCGAGPMAAYGTVSYQMEWLCCYMSSIPPCKGIRCDPTGEN